jgi:hypothetical protein
MGCANIVAPSGGEGIKVVPVVVNCSAKNGEVNFIPKSIGIEFNSYMNRSVVIENLQIAPTTKYSYKWNAKTLKITFAEELKPNTTYTLSIAGKYSDYYGNTAESPFFTCFSTGDIIDSCKIEGKIHTANATGYYIFCYTYKDKDSIDFLKDFPDYKILVGGNGTFVVPALKDGKYIVLAVKDVDKDGIINQTRDTIGIPQFISEIDNCISKYVELIPNYIINPSQNQIDTNINIDTIEINSDIIDTTENRIQIDSAEIIDTNIYLYLKGKIIDTNTNNRYLILTQIGKDFNKQVKINDDNTFLFEDLLAGEYEVFYFIDINENEKFDGGSLVPFQLSEPFQNIEQKIKLNNRWSLDNYIIEIK